MLRAEVVEKGPGTSGPACKMVPEWNQLQPANVDLLTGTTYVRAKTSSVLFWS